MIGPLPPRYRVIVVLTTLLVGLLAGVWVAQQLAVPQSGLGLGLGLGTLAAFLAVVDLRTPAARPHRVRHRR